MLILSDTIRGVNRPRRNTRRDYGRVITPDLSVPTDSTLAIIIGVTAARLLINARRRAGLSQRALARKTGVPHSTVARIELGLLSPRADTLERLLRVTGWTLATEPALGVGVDRSQIRELLRLTPGQRARLTAADAAALDALTLSSR
jgi:transcriptional regulator with XRE-family HTH domain